MSFETARKTPLTTCYGWDIGGAHLKLCGLDAEGKVNFLRTIPTPLWAGLEVLEEIFASLSEELLSEALHGITMTGELCDVFADRSAGVRRLIALFTRYFGTAGVAIYACRDGWLDVEQATRRCDQVASANWRLSAESVAGCAAQAVLVDIGTTTTDLVPVARGQVIASGSDDHTRLVASELLYTGMVRTPVMAICRRARFNGRWQGLMAEHFATSADVYRILGTLPAGVDLLPTPDGAGKDLGASQRRLARMVGVDYRDDMAGSILALAASIAEMQLQHIEAALREVMRCSFRGDARVTLIGAGIGEHVVVRLAERVNLPFRSFASFLDLHQRTSSEIAAVASAVAAATTRQIQHADSYRV